MCLARRGQSCLCVVWGWRGWAHHCSGPRTVLPAGDHWAPPTAIVQMGKLRPRGTRTCRGGLQEQNSPASPLAAASHLSRPGAVPPGSRPHPVGGSAALLGSPPWSQTFTQGSRSVGWRTNSSPSPGSSWLPRAACSQRGWAAPPAPPGALVPASKQLGRDRGLCVGLMFMRTQHGAVGTRVCPGG